MGRKAKTYDHAERYWKQLSEQLFAQAENMPLGRERDAVLRQARQLVTATQMSNWLKSPGLQSPK